ncbi:transglycosylase domain-containing protein [Deferribacteres bacterium DY0037]
MTLKRFWILTACVCLVFFAGISAVLNSEKTLVRGYNADLDEILKGDRSGKSLTIYTADNIKIYEKIYQQTSELPKEVPDDLFYMVEFAGENLFTCDKPDSKASRAILDFYNISETGLNNCIVLFTAEKAIARKGDKVSRLKLWSTAARLVEKYGVRKIILAYMEHSYMQNDIWGVEAAAYSYFGSSVRFLTIAKKAWLISVLTLGQMPDDDPPAFYKRKDMLAYRLYLKGLITYTQYSDAAEQPVYKLHKVVNTMPDYTALVLQELKRKGVKTDRQLVVHTNINLSTLRAAQHAISSKLKKYPDGINIAMAVVNYETGGVEALAANNKWKYHTMQMRRQIGSTFKPIVYLTAIKEGASPNELIVDKKYRYNLGNYVYAPANFEDYYMGKIPMRLGLVHSLNNATIHLAKLAGLRKVSRMAVDLGMDARIKPYLAMPLGIFPITPLNLAKVYAAFGTYGIKKEIGFINRVEDSKGERVYLPKELPRRVSPERETYQVVYMMKDVVRMGTARRSGLISGTAAKTGTTDEYRDAWTVALFPPYAVVCWVGFDSHRSMGERGTGGGYAAPVIAEFQRLLLKDSEKIDFNVPKGIVFKRVDRYTGVVTGKGCGSKRTYAEAFLEERVPPVCGGRNIAFENVKENTGS